jgi:hypothetical protein
MSAFRGVTVVQAALHEADKPEHQGAGYLFQVRTKTGQFYRGGSFSTQEDVRASGVLHLDLWHPDPMTAGGVDGGGRIDREIFIAQDAIESIEIEW